MHTKNSLLLLLSLWLAFIVQQSHAGTTRHLYVRTVPSDARVFIMNIKPKFHQGIQLKSGRYDVLVTKRGYSKWRQSVKLDRNVTLKVALRRIAGKKMLGLQNVSVGKRHLLRIHTIPADAQVEILNLETPFYQGMRLKPGKYQLRVSKEGYIAEQQEVSIRNRDMSIGIALLPPQQCFFGEELAEATKNPQKIHTVKIKFAANKTVQAHYYMRTLTPSAIQHYILTGTRDNGVLELNSQPALQGKSQVLMKLEADRLLIGEEEKILTQVPCREEL